MKFLKFKTAVYTIFLLCTYTGFGQSSAKLDSLKQVLQMNALDDIQKVKTWNAITNIYINEVNLDSASYYNNKALDIVQTLNNPKLLLDTKVKQITIKTEQGEEEEASVLVDEALSYLNATDTSKLLYFYQEKYLIHNRLSNYDSSFYYLEKRLPLLSEDNLRAKIITYGNMAVHFTNLNEYDKAIDYHFKTLEIAQKAKHIEFEAICLGNIGNVYLANEQYEKALSYFKDCEKKHKETEEPSMFNLLWVQDRIANTYELLGKKTEALNMRKESLELGKQSQNKSVIFDLNMGIARHYVVFSLNDSTARIAEQYIKSADNLNADFNTVDKKRYYYVKGLIHEYKEEYQSAINYFLKYDELSKARKSKEGQRTASEKLAQCYPKVGDYKKAYEYHVVFKTLNDSLINDANLAAIEIREAEHEFEIEKAKQDQQLEKAQNSVRNRTFFIIAALLILGLVTAIAFILRRNNQQKTKQNEILEHEVQKRTEELLTSNRELEEIKQKQVLEEAKSRFFANVSHEFRTPLTLIQAPIQRVLQDKTLNTNNVSMLKKALRNSKNLMHLVTDILDLGKLETDKVAVNETSEVLYLVTRRVISNFETYAQSKNITLKLQYLANTDLQIEMDKEKFEKILYNYISNAIKFTQKGGVITVSVNDLKNKIQVAVADNGKGIPTDELTAVFERYYQVKSPNEYAPLGQVNHYAGGTGIGLALCKEYATLLGGQVWAESPNDKNGTTFYFEFSKKEIFAPLEDEDAKTISKKENNSPAPIIASSIQKNSTKGEETPTVLIVEDNHDLRQFLEELLEVDYHIITAENGQDALQKLENNSCQLIISDVMMPIMDGFKLLEQLKSNDKYRHIPTMMLTARAEMKDKLKALRIGVDDYMLKPFNEEELTIRVNNLLLNVSNRLEELSQENLANEENLENDEQPNLVISEKNNEWLVTLEEAVAKRLGDFDLKSDDIAYELNISRSGLFKKTKQLTGLTLTQYIREARLQKARELIENNQVESVKAAAYSVGFKHMNYFSTHYKQRFGKRPSTYF